MKTYLTCKNMTEKYEIPAFSWYRSLWNYNKKRMKNLGWKVPHFYQMSANFHLAHSPLVTVQTIPKINLKKFWIILCLSFAWQGRRKCSKRIAIFAMWLILKKIDMASKNHSLYLQICMILGWSKLFSCALIGSSHRSFSQSEQRAIIFCL